MWIVDSPLLLADPLEDATNLVQVLIWPLLVGGVLAWIALTPAGAALVAGLVGRVRTVNLFGVSLDLSKASATRAKQKIEEVFADYRTRIQREFDRQVSIYKVDEQRRKLVEDFIWDSLGSEFRKDFRCTIHVPDILFKDALYQLLDYYPEGGGRGRTFPSRFGILGRCFRAEKDQYQAHVPTDPKELINEWGMNSQEATAAGRGRHSFACFVINRAEHQPILGILYMDTKEGAAFGEGDIADIMPRIQEGITATGLASALESVGREMRQRGPSIQLSGPQS